MTTHDDPVALVIRKEIVRQYRDDDRGKCPAGANYYEEHIGPEYIAQAARRAVLEEMREWGRTQHPENMHAIDYVTTYYASEMGIK